MLSHDFKSYLKDVFGIENEISHIDELLTLPSKADDKKFHKTVFEVLCSEHFTVKKPLDFDQFSLLQECLDLRITLHDKNDVSPRMFRCILINPKVALYLLERRGYSDELKEYCNKNPAYNLFLATVPMFIQSPQMLRYSLKLLDYLYDKGELKPEIRELLEWKLLHYVRHPEIVQYLYDKGISVGLNQILIEAKNGYHQSARPEILALLKYNALQKETQTILEVTNKKSLKDSRLVKIQL